MKTLSSPSDDFNRRKPGGGYLNRASAKNYNFPPNRAYDQKRRAVEPRQEKGYPSGR
jgi:hypothetical protein